MAQPAAPMLETKTARSPQDQPADAIRLEMEELSKDYRELLPFIYNQERFVDPSRQQDIAVLLQSLSENTVHLAEDRSSRTRHPGYTESLELLAKRLEDARRALRAGNAPFARWRLLSVEQQCIGCHTMMGVENRYYQDPPEEAPLDCLATARYYLASTQAEKAERTLQECVRAEPDSLDRMQAERMLLAHYLAIEHAPDQALGWLHIAPPTKDRELQEAHKQWRTSLQAWKKESSSTSEAQLRTAKDLVVAQRTARSPVLDFSSEVPLLRATALLSHTLAVQTVGSPEWKESVCYLAEAHSRLEEFYGRELPKELLQQCIRNWPESEAAQRAYTILENMIEVDFSGSSGLHIPSDVADELQRFRSMAFSKPTT